ncbi:MAG: hypothetical protein PHD97_00355 [Bacteroidales bacterium]|nr:hypothetical protein [Bacteroidales bacterium]
MSEKEIKSKLNPSLFWEFDFKKIDLKKNKPLIIERVVTRGELDEFLTILAYYGEKSIKEEVIKIRNLDKYTVNYFHLVFKIPKKQFLCYTKRQLD